MHDPDRDLVEASRRGDRKAFGELVNRYYEMVYVVSYGVLREREAARDSAQDVFLKVYRDLHKFKGDSKFKTWLYRVSMNAAIDQTRKRRPQQSLDATDATDRDEAPVIIEEHRPGPRDEAHREDLEEVMRRALDQMSPEHRAILVLREWEGLSYEEIADTLNMEKGTVMSRLHYARKKMGEALVKLGVQPEAAD